jgi:hypothetical protein
LQYINTLTSVLDSTKIVPAEHSLCEEGTALPRQVTEGTAVKKWHKRKNTAAEGYKIKGEYG